VIEWLATERLEVEKVATPPLSVPVPKVVAPSRNVTVPVAVEGDTVAVKVTDWPDVEGLRLEATPVVVFVLLTVCVRGAEVLVL
jgi:hypothetical protein